MSEEGLNHLSSVEKRRLKNMQSKHEKKRILKMCQTHRGQSIESGISVVKLHCISVFCKICELPTFPNTVVSHSK